MSNVVCPGHSAYGRGPDAVKGAYHLLDLTPKERNEGDSNWINYQTA